MDINYFQYTIYIDTEDSLDPLPIFQSQSEDESIDRLSNLYENKKYAPGSLVLVREPCSVLLVPKVNKNTSWYSYREQDWKPGNPINVRRWRDGYNYRNWKS